MRKGMVGLVIAALGLLPAAGRAQGDPSIIPPGKALGITVDRFNFGSNYDIGAVTFHVSALHPDNFSPEFAISLFPQALAAGTLVTNLDLGGAINIPVPHAMLLIRGGASGVFALGGGGGALPGVHYGASLLIKFAEKSGFRFDLLRHVYFIPYEFSQPMFTIGIGITSLPALK